MSIILHCMLMRVIKTKCGVSMQINLLQDCMAYMEITISIKQVSLSKTQHARMTLMVQMMKKIITIWMMVMMTKVILHRKVVMVSVKIQNLLILSIYQVKGRFLGQLVLSMTVYGSVTRRTSPIQIRPNVSVPYLMQRTTFTS